MTVTSCIRTCKSTCKLRASRMQLGFNARGIMTGRKPAIRAMIRATIKSDDKIERRMELISRR